MKPTRTRARLQKWRQTQVLLGILAGSVALGQVATARPRDRAQAPRQGHARNAGVRRAVLQPRVVRATADVNPNRQSDKDSDARSEGIPRDDAAVDSASWSDGTMASGPQVDLDTLAQRGDSYVARLEGGGLAELTLRQDLQNAAQDVLSTFHVPFGAAAVISVRDGRVLALVGHADSDPSLGPAQLALQAWAPAASVFKVVSASAMVTDGGLSGESRVCYHGGVSSLLPDNLIDSPRLDQRCDTLSVALGKSQNAVIAKLANRHLTPESLGRMAAAFGFGQALPFDAPLGASTIDVPSEPLEFARTAAGFYHSSLSVLHGALIAATIANDGRMPQPRLIARATDSLGGTLALPAPISRRVLGPEAARMVGKMMELTTKIGTARTTFRTRSGARLLPVDVAGKTGTLNFRGAAGDPTLPGALIAASQHLGYSWFIGYAPADHPQIAFAVLLGNEARWRIKATYLARRLVEEQIAARTPAGPNRGAVATR